MKKTAPGSFYQHGWQSWNVAAWRPANAQLRYPMVPAHRLQSTDPQHLDDPHPGGANVGALELQDGNIELLGALSLDTWVTNEPGGMVASGGGEWFRQTGEEHPTFKAYADELKRVFGARKGKFSRVWCSWYSFYNSITEVAMVQVLEGLGDLQFDVVQIDDGWQQANGDWVANKDFAGGMESIAAKIKDTGRTAGLWLAPFIVDPRSELFRKYPEMVLRDSAGDPVIAAFNWGPSYTLDVTRDDAKAWLAGEMQRVVGQGYDYLKLDFLYSASLPGCYQNDCGREQAYREASEVIREAVGEAVYLLACGAPVIPSIGIYDGLRVGPDVSEVWDNVDRTVHLADRAGPGGADAITTTLGRYWLKDLIDIDPDIAYFRSRYCMLNDRQKSYLADLAQICQFKANSDLPAWLLPEERQQLASFLEASPVVKQLDRYRFLLDDREVDFSRIVQQRPW